MAPQQYSSFQIGKMLNVSRQAVNQWIDKGYIQSYRTPGGHRRVNQQDLLAFLRERNIPLPELLRRNASGPKPHAQRHVMLLIHYDEDYLTLTRNAVISKRADIRVSTFNNAIDLLMAIGVNAPDLLVMNLDMPFNYGLELIRRLRNNELSEHLPIMVLVREENPLVLNQLSELAIRSIQPRGQTFNTLAVRIIDEVRQVASPVMK